MLSHSEENYLKAIFHLRSNEGYAVSTTELADHLKTKPSSVTDMLQRLSSNHWVDYRKYKGVILSQNGEQAAGITFTKPSPLLISMPGASNDQKLAATITPPVKPSMPSNTARFILLKRNTSAAPAAVNPQVNKVAKNAA